MAKEMKAKVIRILKEENMQKRLQDILQKRDEFLSHVDDVHVKLQDGNSKTGAKVKTVSLAPVIDCLRNCKNCMKECYDTRNDCCYPSVRLDRARNSAIHKANPSRYWNEISQLISEQKVDCLRINVGGDLTDDDFAYVDTVAKWNPTCKILLFTKNYQGANAYMDKNGDFAENLQIIFSAWKDTEMVNPYNMPESHVLYVDGSTTAPEYGAYYCGGDCTECFMEGKGCMTLKKGEHVIFMAH